MHKFLSCVHVTLYDVLLYSPLHFSRVPEQLGANFLMFVDPYHKQVYQISGSGDVTIRKPHGIPLPYMEFPDVVGVNEKNGEYVYLDTRVNEIRSAKMLKKKKKEEVKTLWEIPDGKKLDLCNRIS